MNETICPICGKSNPGSVEICQSCGSVLKRNATEPLPPIRPGDIPEKRKTSDLERTLPGWLRDARKASKTDGSAPEPDKPAPVQPFIFSATAPTSKNPAPAPPTDFLAGLSHLDDDEEEAPDWLKNLQNSMPAPEQAKPEPTPEQQPMPDDSSGLPGLPEQPFFFEKDTGFAGQPAAFIFDENSAADFQNTDVVPDWLNALKTQDEINKEQALPSPFLPDLDKSSQPEAATDPSIYADLPDWLATLTGNSAEPVRAQPESRPSDQNLTPVNASTDWLSSLGGDFNAGEPASVAEQAAPDNSETPDWLGRMGTDNLSPAEPTPLENVPAFDVMPDWLDSPQDNSSQPPAVAASAPVTLAPADDMPDWLTSLQDNSTQPPAVPASRPEAPRVGNECPDWCTSRWAP